MNKQWVYNQPTKGYNFENRKNAAHHQVRGQLPRILYVILKERRLESYSNS